jgi:hypothetical protein
MNNATMEFFVYEIVDTYNYEEQSEYLDVIDVIRQTDYYTEALINPDLDQVIFFLNLN